jgi:hypothetical protein
MSEQPSGGADLEKLVRAARQQVMLLWREVRDLRRELAGALGRIRELEGRDGASSGPISLSDVPAPCPRGCEHPLTVHSADLGCWLCDCTHGREPVDVGAPG